MIEGIPFPTQLMMGLSVNGSQAARAARASSVRGVVAFHKGIPVRAPRGRAPDSEQASIRIVSVIACRYSVRGYPEQVHDPCRPVSLTRRVDDDLFAIGRQHVPGLQCRDGASRRRSRKRNRLAESEHVGGQTQSPKMAHRRCRDLPACLLASLVPNVDGEADVGISPSHVSQFARDLDDLTCIEIGGDRVMRPNCRRRQH